MCYKDDEMLYLTTRIEVERGFIVAYRCPVINNERGAEEHRLIHVADIEKLLRLFTSSEKLLVDIGVHTTKIHEISDGGDERSEGSENNAGQAVAGATSDVLETNNSGRVSTTMGAEPMGVPRSESGRELMRQRSHPAATGQGVPTGSITEEGQPQMESREPAVITTRSGKVSQQRKQMNVKQLGDVTKVLVKTKEGDEIEVEVPDCLSESRDTLLYHDIFKSKDPRVWFAAAKDECMSLIVQNNVFESGELPPGAKTLQTKWVFKRN